MPRSRHPAIRRVTSACALAAVGLLLGGCLRGPLGGARDEASLVRDGDVLLVPGITVPPARGPAGCGAQALATVLAHGDAGAGLDPVALGDALPWHDEGATPVDLLLAARARGWTASIHAGDHALLAREVAAGHPPLVMLDVGLEVRTLLSRIDLPRVMHWAVVTGVATDGSAVLLGAPRGRHHVVDADWFDERWARADRCTLILRPPIAAWDRSPGSAGPADSVAQADGVEAGPIAASGS